MGPGGSVASYLARAPSVPLLYMLCFVLRNLFPLTALKIAPNPKFVQNLSQRLFLGVPVRGPKFVKNCQNLSENCGFSNFDSFLQIFGPLTGTPQRQSLGQILGQILDKLGFGAFLNAVRGKRSRKFCRSRNRKGF